MNIEESVLSLSKQLDRMKSYLLLKFEVSDWHGVADAAMDIREIEAKLSVLKNIKTEQT
jgi:hypothetical protein